MQVLAGGLYLVLKQLLISNVPALSTRGGANLTGMFHGCCLLK
jgi:hypothetical protein